MKKISLSIIALFSTALSINAQITEGSVLYTMNIEGMPPEQAAMMGDMELRSTFKNGKVLTEMNSMMFSNQILIDEKGMTMIMDQMGNKTAITLNKDEYEKENSKIKEKGADPKYEYTSETKMIAGYECKKAITTITHVNNKKENIDIWYCEKFANPNIEGRGKGQEIMKGLKGMAFEYVANNGPMKFKIVAKEVSEAPVADEKFKISTEGYKIMKMDDLKALQGGK